MRQGLTDAERLSPVKGGDDIAYPAGSIVVCYTCGKPLYKLQANIYNGEKPSRSAWKYAPVNVFDLRVLMERRDLDPGIRAAIKLLTVDEQIAHCATIPTLKSGDFFDCAACKRPFVFSRTSSNGDGPAEFIDRAYVIQLATIPPVGKARRLTRVSA